MSVSLSDILTAAKNVVTAINGLVTTYLGLQGVQVANGITTTTLVTTKAGRLSKLSVMSSGTGSAGTAYDSNSTSNLTNPICAISSTAGVYVVDIPFVNGLVIVPGASDTITVVYTTGSPVGFTGG